MSTRPFGNGTCSPPILTHAHIYAQVTTPPYAISPLETEVADADVNDE